MTLHAAASPIASASLGGLFDDAGVFPPASLPLDEAFDAHRAALAGAFRWMLARFVLPIDRLAELAAVASRFGERLRLSLVGDPATVDLDEGAQLVDEHGWRVDSLEAKLPDADVERHAQRLREAASAFGAGRVFLEVPWGELPADAPEQVVAALASAGSGLKVRCGGRDPSDYPAPALLAALFRTCADAEVAMKATAGLHHPFRHEDDSGALSHGFVNLLLAAGLTVERAAEPVVAAAIAEADRGAIAVEAERLSWRDFAIGTDAIAAARRHLLSSIGTCSFREPVDDLVALGLLPAP